MFLPDIALHTNELTSMRRVAYHNLLNGVAQIAPHARFEAFGVAVLKGATAWS